LHGVSDGALVVFVADAAALAQTTKSLRSVVFRSAVQSDPNRQLTELAWARKILFQLMAAQTSQIMLLLLHQRLALL